MVLLTFLLRLLNIENVFPALLSKHKGLPSPSSEVLEDSTFSRLIELIMPICSSQLSSGITPFLVLISLSPVMASSKDFSPIEYIFFALIGSRLHLNRTPSLHSHYRNFNAAIHPSDFLGCFALAYLVPVTCRCKRLLEQGRLP